ncbi:fatty-acid amide hydrolase 2-A-like [Colletes latitarsis]|uniref:fatty-acid amide hydrolase 2-A-like n=1 Tax=Colletes latitarsis TaxID=2605962 RepID=UPI0040354F45
MFRNHLITIFMWIVYSLLRPIFAYVYSKERKSVPAIKNPLLTFSAAKLAKKVRQGELSSQTVVEAYIERIKEVNYFVNAVVDERFEAAINDAKACDAKLKSGQVTAIILEKEKPLFGIPFTVKEACSVAGMSYTGGNLARKGMKATEDGSAVELLKNAGAIPLCVTNTPEFCLGTTSTNNLFGTTKNPYDTSKTCGGSSGGEGALIGAGASVLGIGSDILGSIRIPSHFCGIFGHKPTPGILSTRGHLPTAENNALHFMAVFGPMARYTEDLHLAMKILSSKCERPLRLDEPVDVKTLRVFYVDNIDSVLGTRSTSTDIRRTIKLATNYLEKNGAQVTHTSQEWVRDSFLFLLTSFLSKDNPEELVDKSPDARKKLFLELLKALVGLSNNTLQFIFTVLMIEFHGFIPRSDEEYYNVKKDTMRETINKALGNDGVFICPTYPQAASIAELSFLRNDCVVYTSNCNCLQLPSTHVPMGFNDEGLPIGFQVIAGSYQDRLCLGVAREMEKAFGGWIPPTS